MKDLAICMPMFRGVDLCIYEHNFQSYVNTNPHADIFRFKDSEAKDPFLKEMLKFNLLAWRNADLIFLDFYRQHPDYERYLLVEWDSYCTFDVRKMLDPVRKLDLVCREVYKPQQSSWWAFGERSRIPTEFHPFICGTTPLCGITAPARTLEKLAEPHPLTQLDIFADLRFGTLAATLGFKPASYPLYGNTLYFDSPLTLNKVRGEGIFHRLKARYFPPGPPAPGCPMIGVWAGTTLIGEKIFRLNDDGNIILDGKIIGQWVHIEKDREMILSWDDHGVEWYYATPDIMHQPMRRVVRVD